MKVTAVKITPYNEATFLNRIHNFDNPLATRMINGNLFRIAHGLPIDKKHTYILYKNDKFVGTYSSVEEAKEFVL